MCFGGFQVSECNEESDSVRMQKKKEPKFGSFMCLGAENETRTRDPNLGKVVLYQLSYFRRGIWFVVFVCVKRRRLELPRRN